MNTTNHFILFTNECLFKCKLNVQQRLYVSNSVLVVLLEKLTKLCHGVLLFHDLLTNVGSCKKTLKAVLDGMSI